MTSPQASCPQCHAHLSPAPEALARMRSSGRPVMNPPLATLGQILRSRRSTGIILNVISCVTAIPALFGSFIALGCAFGKGEFGGNGEFGVVAIAMLITLGLCAMGFLPLYFGIKSLKQEGWLRLVAGSWMACPACGWAEETIPPELAEELPILVRGGSTPH